MTKASGKSRVVTFSRFACNKHLRHTMYWFSFVSVNHSEWAKLYYRDRGIKAIAITKRCAPWEPSGQDYIFAMWRDHKPYYGNYHLANIARQKMRLGGVKDFLKRA